MTSKYKIPKYIEGDDEEYEGEYEIPEEVKNFPPEINPQTWSEINE